MLFYVFGMLLREINYHNTLNRVPMEENFVDFEDSSDEVGNKLATKEQVEALKSA